MLSSEEQKNKLDEAEQSVAKQSSKKKKLLNIGFFILNIAILAGMLSTKPIIATYEIPLTLLGSVNEIIIHTKLTTTQTICEKIYILTWNILTEGFVPLGDIPLHGWAIVIIILFFIVAFFCEVTFY